MRLTQRRTLAAGILVAAALATVILPALAAPASQTFQVATDHNSIVHGQTLRIIPFVKQSTGACAWTVLLTVVGPSGSATDTVTLTTQPGGNGQTAVTFPTDFSGTGANTNTPGTYTVTASFTCGYTTGTATVTFTVT